MSYNAILFDLDGTLLDTLEDLADAANRVLSARGFPGHPLDSYRYFIGDGAAMLIRRSLPADKRHDDIIHDCLDAFLRDYGRNWNVKTKPYKGIPELLDSLTSREIKMAVLSNKPHDFTKFLLKISSRIGRLKLSSVSEKRFPQNPIRLEHWKSPGGSKYPRQIFSISVTVPWI